MLDTVIFYLHDVRKHVDLKNFLMTESKSSRTSFLRFMPMAEMYREDPEIVLDMVKFGDTGRLTAKQHFKKLHVPSSNYFIVTTVDLQRDFIYFNFSIPKYLYGNNIAQFVPGVNNPSFIYGVDKDFETQIKKLPKRFLKFIKEFFAREFIDIPIDFSELEIRRLDFCYNEICHSEKDAMRKLAAQKIIAKKYQRKNSDRQSDYETGVSYRTANYYFKIYHKGSEYQKDDSKEHLAINSLLNRELDRLAESDDEYIKEISESFENQTGKLHECQTTKAIGLDYKTNVKRRQLNALVKQGFDVSTARALVKDKNIRYNFFDVDFLQQLSNKILRYEVSFTNVYMSNLYKRKIFKEKDSKYQLEKVEYKRLHNLSNKGSDIEKLTTFERRFYETFRKNLQRTHEFYPFFKENAEPQSDLSVMDQKNSCWSKKMPLTSRLLNQLGKEFHAMIMELQPCAKEPMHQVIDAVDNLNKGVKQARKHFGDIKFHMSKYERNMFIGKGLNKNKVVMILSLLDQYKSFDNIKKLKLFSDRTISRYQKDMEKLGMLKNTVADYYGTFSPIDYTDYYQILLTQWDRLYNNKYVIDLY